MPQNPSPSTTPDPSAPAGVPPVKLRCLLTAGPTREHLDPVRFLSNGSSGKMGFALAAACAKRGWEVHLVSGPVALPPPPGVHFHPVVSAAEMLAACEPMFDACDLFIAVAAVADFRPKKFSPKKQRKPAGSLRLELVPTVDILKTLAVRKQATQVVVGFAAETDDLEVYARRKLADKQLDWIVANDVGQPGIGMDADNNTILLLGASGGRESFGPAPKADVAEFILSHLASQETRLRPGA